jgi:hypothetical protein
MVARFSEQRHQHPDHLHPDRSPAAHYLATFALSASVPSTTPRGDLGWRHRRHKSLMISHANVILAIDMSSQLRT